MATPKDVIGNPKQLKSRELEAAMPPRTLDEVDQALINTNYAPGAGLNPTRDALLIEDKDPACVNYLAGRPDNQDDPRVQKLAKVLNSPGIKAFIEQKYHAAVLPAFQVLRLTPAMAGSRTPAADKPHRQRPRTCPCPANR